VPIAVAAAGQFRNNALKMNPLRLTVTTVALFGAVYLGILLSRGTPANNPPRQGEERMSLTINTRDGGKVEVVIHETFPGNIYVSSSVVK